MADERESTERFTDEDLAFLRHVRFGELPTRVRPDEMVQLIETEPSRDVPDLTTDPHYDLRRGGA
jgi:hypothetical protein